MPIFIHFPPLGTIIYWWELQTVMGDLSVHPKDPRQPLEKDPPDPHRHDVGLCGPVVIVEHHHSQHHTARHHHHDAVEVRAWTGKVTKYGASLTRLRSQQGTNILLSIYYTYV